jgi:uncharacterized membrane protein (UPF0182 family)
MVSLPLKIPFFRPPKCRKEALWIIDSYGTRVSLPLRKHISGRENAKKAFIRNQVSRVEEVWPTMAAVGDFDL